MNVRSSRFKNTTVALLLVFACFGAYLCWKQLNPEPSDAKDFKGIGAPVLSPRRTPEYLLSLINDAALRKTISETINANDLSHSTQFCMSIRSGEREIQETHDTTALMPASTMKLLTAAAALRSLGDSRRFSTVVKSTNAPKNGVVNGQLYLVGGGDPLLLSDDYAKTLRDKQVAHTRLESLADSVVQAGVKSVTGGVVGDGTRFDNQRYLPGWEQAYITQGDVGPISGLSVNQGFTKPRVGAQDPSQDGAGVFTAMLRARGIKIAKDATSGQAPPKGTQIASIESLSVAEIVREMLTESDNTTAEMLIKNLASGSQNADKPIAQGSTQAGLTVARKSLEGAGIPLDGLVMNDGSGLSRSNRASCATLVEAVGYGGFNGPIYLGLPIAGESGTLAQRMNNTAAAKVVHAKTGTLANVSALVGWSTPNAKEPTSFAVINNGMSTDVARSIEDQIALDLAMPAGSPASGAELAPDDGG